MRRTETHVTERRDGGSGGKSNHHVLAVGGADEVDAAVHRRWQQRFIELARANRIRRRLDTAPRLQLREALRPSLSGLRRGAVRLFQVDHRHIAMTCVLGGLLRKVFADAVTRDGVIGDEEMGVLFLFLFWFFLFVVLVVAVVFGVAVVGVL